MRTWLALALAVAIGAGVLATGGIGGALALENQDAFCAACHTEPEVKYVDQAQRTRPVSLAAYHAGKQTACIDCHSAGGTFGRGAGLQQGAHDLAAYLSGRYSRPAVTSNPLGDDSCLKCHANIVGTPTGDTRAMNGHYHAFLLRWQAQDPNAGGCTTCHTAHTTGTSGLQFMSQGAVARACDQCHTALSGTQ